MYNFILFIKNHNNFKNYIKSLLIVFFACIMVNFVFYFFMTLGMPVNDRAQKFMLYKTIVAYLFYCVFTICVWWRVYSNSRRK